MGSGTEVCLQDWIVARRNLRGLRIAQGGHFGKLPISSSRNHERALCPPEFAFDFRKGRKKWLSTRRSRFRHVDTWQGRQACV